MEPRPAGHGIRATPLHANRVITTICEALGLKVRLNDGLASEMVRRCLTIHVAMMAIVTSLSRTSV